tara:strand:+ start:206 stop:523 length:318 start_codon:yes stop_codon:yes gene_type:complete
VSDNGTERAVYFTLRARAALGVMVEDGITDAQALAHIQAGLNGLSGWADAFLDVERTLPCELATPEDIRAVQTAITDTICLDEIDGSLFWEAYARSLGPAPPGLS